MKGEETEKKEKAGNYFFFSKLKLSKRQISENGFYFIEYELSL